MYNRAAADPRGNPWPKEARLARQFGSGAQGYVYWDPDAEGPDPANPSRLIRGRWVGLDVPDFPLTKPPTAAAKPDGLGLDFHDGASPFIMKADGKGWLFTPSGLVDGPLPAHYEPYESPVPNLVYPARSSNPAAKVYNVPGNPYAPVGSAEYPCVLSTYRLTEHHLSGSMSRWLPWLSALQPELFVELSPEHAREIGVINLGTVQIVTPRAAIRAKALVTPRIRPLPDRRQGRPSRRHALALGIQGDQQGRRRQRSLGPGRRPQRDHPRGQGFRLPGGKTRGCGKERLIAPDTRDFATHGNPSACAVERAYTRLLAR